MNSSQVDDSVAHWVHIKDRTTFQGGLGHMWPHSLSSVNTNESWATSKDRLLKSRSHKSIGFNTLFTSRGKQQIIANTLLQLRQEPGTSILERHKKKILLFLEFYNQEKLNKVFEMPTANSNSSVQRSNKFGIKCSVLNHQFVTVLPRCSSCKHLAAD